MSLALVIEQFGGPEVLALTDRPLPPPGPGEVAIRHTAIGLNFIDTYHRSGLYRIPLPSGLGMEGAGIVTALGAGVEGFAVGDRVAYATSPLGACAVERVVPASVLVRVPEAIPDEIVAAVLLKGLTACYLLHLTHELKAGETILVHAAAGGVGSLLVPWAAKLGARVIAVVGSAAKAALARAAGAAEVIDSSQTADLAAEVRRLTGGRGVDVVYDSTGASTFMASLDCLRRRGLMVSYGNASGKPPAIEPTLLTDKGSLFLTRPTLGHYVGTPEELRAVAATLFAAIADGTLNPVISQRYALAEVAQAHRDLEARRTTGLSVLIP